MDAAASQYGQSADWYDRIYAHAGKDYRAEADIVDDIVRARAPRARSLLDVGCGTGLHLREFSKLYGETAGLDLDPGFVAAARGRGLRATVGDMRDFSLGRQFDAVVSLFSAVGHLADVAELTAAVGEMSHHLVVGGVMMIEPWISPEAWREGYYGVEIAEAPGSTLVRVNQSASDGNVSVLTFAWTEVSAAGVQRLDEELRLTRFTSAEYASAFEAAGVDVSFDEQGLNASGRGLWIGTKRP